MGAAHARAFAARGARVIVNDLGGNLDGSGADDGPAEAVAQQIRDLAGPRPLPARRRCDVSRRAECDGRQQAIDQFGRLDGVLRDAGRIETLVEILRLLSDKQ